MHDKYMNDICDGEYVRGNQLFQQIQTALQIVLNSELLIHLIPTPRNNNIKTLFYYRKYTNTSQNCR